MFAALVVPTLIHQYVVSNIGDVIRLAYEAKLLEMSNPQDLILLKLNFLVDKDIASAKWMNVRFFVFLTAWIVTVAAFTVYIFIQTKSHLVLNVAAKNQRDLSERRNGKLRRGSIFAFLLGALAGVAGNKLTSLLDSLLLSIS